MKNKFVVLLVVALFTTLLVPVAFSQANCTVRGVVKGEDGKPLAGITVLFSSEETGRKFPIKTDKSGNYFSISVVAGRYKITLLDANGQPLYPGYYVVADVSLQSRETVNDIDMQKARAAAASQMSEEDKKKIESVKKENAKIGTLNEKLKLSAALQNQGQYEEAVKTMEEAAALDSTKDIILGSLASAYLNAAKHNSDRTAAKDEFTKSADAYQKAIALKPLGAYYNNMGEAYAKLGNSQAAIDAYNKAAEIDPTDAAKYYFNLGAILTNIGKPDEANTAFEKAIAADPNKADAYYQKAINLMSKASIDKDGKVTAPPEVAQGLNKYLELAPEGPYAQTAKDMLTSLGAKVETSFGKKAPAASRKK